MDPNPAARLHPGHLRRLEWFEDHAGEAGPRPEPLEGHLPLVHPRMGICKPRELEAAHLLPYRGPDSNDLRNGLLLRAGIHTLLDLMLIAFKPDDRTVVISSRPEGTHSRQLPGMRLAEPRLAQQRPAPEILHRVWQDFTNHEAAAVPRTTVSDR